MNLEVGQPVAIDPYGGEFDYGGTAPYGGVVVGTYDEGAATRDSLCVRVRFYDPAPDEDGHAGAWVEWDFAATSLAPVDARWPTPELHDQPPTAGEPRKAKRP